MPGIGVCGVVCAAFVSCGPRKIEIVDTIERGALRCIEKVERRQVNNYWWELFSNNRPFLPEHRDSNIVGSCRASRNRDVEVIVFLMGDSCWRLLVDGGVARAVRIERPPGMDSIEQFKTAIWSCNGRCLMWRDLLVYVETGQIHRFAHSLPDELIGLSPDLKTAVAAGQAHAENQISIELMDIETGAVEVKLLDRHAHAWLLDYREGRDAIAEQFKWRRVNGRDILEYP